MAFKSARQRKSFFARIKQSIASVPSRIHTMEEEHRVKQLKRMADETKQLAAEEKKIRTEIRARQIDESAREAVEKRKAELSELKKIQFEHSKTGKALAAVEHAGAVAGRGIGRGAVWYGSKVQAGAKFIAPYAKKGLYSWQKAAKKAMR